MLTGYMGNFKLQFFIYSNDERICKFKEIKLKLNLLCMIVKQFKLNRILRIVLDLWLKQTLLKSIPLS